MAARTRMWAVAPWAAMAAFTVLIAHFSVRVHSIQPDERLSIAGSRFVLDHPLWAIEPSRSLTGRGFERLVAVVFGLVQWVVSDTARAYWTQHVLSAAFIALVVPVIAAWGRDLGLERWQGLTAGVIACCVPWMVLGTSFINSCPAYSLTALALWTMWRSAVSPSPGRDLLALLALLLLAVARVGNVVVAVAWPLAIIAFTLHARRPLSRIVRDHPLLLLAAVAAVAGLLIKGTHWLAGGYGVYAPPGKRFADILRVYTATVAVGTAVVPVVLAIAWCARSLVRPVNAGAAAFAAMVPAAFLALTYAAATQAAEERYIAPIVPLVLLAGVLALTRPVVNPLLVLVAGILVGRGIAVTGVGLDIGPYGFFALAAQTFFRRVVLGKASIIGPLPDHHVLTAVLVIAVAGAMVVVLLARRRPRVACGLMAAAVGAYGLAAGVYSMSKFSDQAGYPGLTFAQQSWIDGAVGPHAQVAMAPEGLAGVATELADFNRALGSPYAPPRATLHVNPTTGAITGVPRYLLVQSGLGTSIGITGRVVAQTQYLPQNALLLEPLHRALWLETSPRALTVFAPNRGDCLTATLTGGRGRFSIGSARGVLTGVPLAVAVKLPQRPVVRLKLRGGGAATITGLGRGPCP